MSRETEEGGERELELNLRRCHFVVYLAPPACRRPGQHVSRRSR